MAETAKAPRLTDQALKEKILALLDENRVMTVATLRPDGWPQATLVGYIHDELTLYFVVARDSQKLANIHRDGRVSIALGHETSKRLRGLSMAAQADEIMEPAEVVRLNSLVRRRYPNEVIFSPRRVSSALIRAKPSVISIIDLPRGPGDPELVRTDVRTTVRRLKAASGEGKDAVSIRYVHGRDAYRPDAPF